MKTFKFLLIVFLAAFINISGCSDNLTNISDSGINNNTDDSEPTMTFYVQYQPNGPPDPGSVVTLYDPNDNMIFEGVANSQGYCYYYSTIQLYEGIYYATAEKYSNENILIHFGIRYFYFDPLDDTPRIYTIITNPCD